MRGTRPAIDFMARPGLGVALLAVLGVGPGCARYVVRVETEPAGAAVTVNGSTSRENRWSLSGDEPATLLAKWPDGKEVTAQVVIDRDATIVMRRDGEPGQIVGARVVAMAAAPTAPLGATTAPPPAPPGTTDPGLAPPPPVTVTPGPADPMARARQLYDEGQKAYELTDFDVAIEKFRAAYELIRSSDDPAAPEVLAAVMFNLAVVHERSYEVKPDPERLRRARVMYRQYDEQMASITPNWAKSSEHAEVLARIRALEARLEPAK
ncbi:MAG TPA: hypothetical protein VIK91_09845 [Nannocystis sp.]